MPNWCSNRIAFRGKKENVLNFINDGLKNSDRETYSTIDRLEDAVADLKANATVKEFSTSFKKEDDETKGVMKLSVQKGLYLGTFRPMDELYKYDTTNYPELFPDVVKEQKEKFGAVGWYDYNVDVRFGTKWDAELEDFEYKDCDDEAIISVTCDTAWSAPMLFLRWVKDTFGLYAFIMAIEEGMDFAFYCEIDGEEQGSPYSDVNPWDCERAENEEGYEDEYWEKQQEYYDNMEADFMELVDEWNK